MDLFVTVFVLFVADYSVEPLLIYINYLHKREREKYEFNTTVTINNNELPLPAYLSKGKTEGSSFSFYRATLR